MSREKAFDLLYAEFKAAEKPALWAVDENISTADIPKPIEGIQAVTNRIDVAQKLTELGWQCHFQDYQLLELHQQGIKTILLRIPKEKAQAHALINQAASLLKGTGKLILTGLKQEGIKGFIQRAESLSEEPAELWKSDKETWASAISFKSPSANPTLDDKDYSLLRQQPTDNYFTFWSKPGIFGWDKIDKGSELLISHLSDLLNDSEKPEKALDLGCGYGYLSVHTARLLNIPITATDNNAAAVIACKQNFETFRLSGEVFADNCAESITDRYPLIICNPPFHSGFGVENDLTDRFLASAAKHLTSQGCAIFVTNLHIPLERKAAVYFKQCETPITSPNFKLIKLRQPKL